VGASTPPELPRDSPGPRRQVEITPAHFDRLTRPLTEEQECLHDAGYLGKLRCNVGRLTIEGLPQRYDFLILEHTVPASLPARAVSPPSAHIRSASAGKRRAMDVARDHASILGGSVRGQVWPACVNEPEREILEGERLPRRDLHALRIVAASHSGHQPLQAILQASESASRGRQRDLGASIDGPAMGAQGAGGRRRLDGTPPPCPPPGARSAAVRRCSGWGRRPPIPDRSLPLKSLITRSGTIAAFVEGSASAAGRSSPKVETAASTKRKTHGPVPTHPPGQCFRTDALLRAPRGAGPHSGGRCVDVTRTGARAWGRRAARGAPARSRPTERRWSARRVPARTSADRCGSRGRGWCSALR
jgi:hypothetical protein